MAMRKTIFERIGLAIVLVGMGFGLIGTGCAESGSSEPSDTVIVVSDNTVAFSEFSTFALVESDEDPESPPPNVSEENKRALETAIVDNMTALGYIQVAEDEADLLVSSFGFIETLEAVVTGYYYYNWFWYEKYWWYDAEDMEFEVVTVVVDAWDTKDRANEDDDRLVFRGNVFGVFADEPQESARRIAEAVDSIFREWPED